MLLVSKAFVDDAGADSGAEDSDGQNNNEVDESKGEWERPATQRRPRPSQNGVKPEGNSDDEDEEDEEDEEEEEVALDDVSEVEEDTVPRQKIVINNEVGSWTIDHLHLTLVTADLSQTYTRDHQAQFRITLDRPFNPNLS